MNNTAYGWIDVDVVTSDKFLEMPIRTQGLYFHLCLRADDKGFIHNPKAICRLVKAEISDLEILCLKGFVVKFGKAIFIKDWIAEEIEEGGE